MDNKETRDDDNMKAIYQRFSYYWEMDESVISKTGETVTANMNHVVHPQPII